MQPATLTREEICRLVPQRGAMCLIDAVERWDAESIVCVTSGHRSPDHPLRSKGRLPAVAGIEYAAQAVAIHGALVAPDGKGGVPGGVLAGVRETRLHVARLDDIEGEIRVEARRLIRQRYNLLYSFRITANKKILLEGRAAISLSAQATA